MTILIIRHAHTVLCLTMTKFVRRFFDSIVTLRRSILVVTGDLPNLFHRGVPIDMIEKPGVFPPSRWSSVVGCASDGGGSSTESWKWGGREMVGRIPPSPFVTKPSQSVSHDDDDWGVSWLRLLGGTSRYELPWGYFVCLCQRRTLSVLDLESFSARSASSVFTTGTVGTYINRHIAHYSHHRTVVPQPARYSLLTSEIVGTIPSR